MRINGHAHIFNLQTVLTTEAFGILIDRLKRNNYRDFIVEAVKELLQEQVTKPEYLTEDELLRLLLKKIAKTQGFKNFVGAAATLPVEVRLLGTGIEDLGVDALKAALDRLSTYLDARDGKGRGIYDLYDALRIAMQPDITSVADRLLQQLQSDDVLVALMMDIVATPEPAADKAKFLAQVKGTSQAALARPGRILPFIAVNTARTDHFAVMRKAIEQQGFVGVKLYPSLGYTVNTPAMDAIFKYCLDNDVPILSHTTAGGFFKSAATTDFSNPSHWKTVLAKYPKLRVCFAHCGGWGGFCNQDPLQVPWWDDIVEMIRLYDNVYGDLAHHVDPMAGGAAETAYVASLKALIADPKAGKRIIFGTDSWIVRMHVSENTYWKYFEDQLTAAEFTAINQTVPAEFLGIPLSAAYAPRENIKRHVEWLEDNADRVGADPLPWVKQLTSAAFSPTRTNPRWSPNNRAHVLLYQFFRFSANQIPKPLQSLKFDGSASIRLRQLGYYTKGHEPDNMFEQRCEENAANLDTYLINAQGTYEAEYDADSAIEKLTELMADGDRTLSDTAAAVDAIYRFATEV